MAKPTKAQEREKQEALERLRGWLKPGDTIYCVLRSRARSGMSRCISFLGIEPPTTAGGRPELRDYDHNIALVLGLQRDREHEGLRVGGCGMDMGFHVVYELSRELWPDGYGCTGENCRSNDHSNGDTDRTPHGTLYKLEDAAGIVQQRPPVEHWHKDSGYALRHIWL